MIVRNSIRCRECETEAVSDNRHDFKSCSCGNVAADGGYDYLRRVGNVGSYDETTIVAPCLATNECGVRGVLVGFYLLVIPDTEGDIVGSDRYYVGHDLVTGGDWTSRVPTDLENLPQVTAIP